jgi:predicted nucleic acid-binding protein
MRVINTSAWIEWLIASQTGDAIASQIPKREDWLVPTIIQIQLAKWLAREVGEDTKIALAAAEICGKHKLATADAIIYATVLEHGADLLTCDAHFENLPGVIYIAKINP